MSMEAPSKVSWGVRRQRKAERLAGAGPYADGRVLEQATIVQALETLIRPGTEKLRRDGLVAFPEDLGIRPLEATRSLLAAKSIEDLVAWSGGVYHPPARFRSW